MTVVELFLFVIWPLYIALGSWLLWRTRDKPPEWRTSKAMTWPLSLPRDRYRQLLVVMIGIGVVGVIMFTVLLAAG